MIPDFFQGKFKEEPNPSWNPLEVTFPGFPEEELDLSRIYPGFIPELIPKL